MIALCTVSLSGSLSQPPMAKISLHTLGGTKMISRLPKLIIWNHPKIPEVELVKKSTITAILIAEMTISRPKFIFGCDPRHQEVHRVRHELAERHGADCIGLGTTNSKST